MAFAPRETEVAERLAARVFRVERRHFVADGEAFDRDVVVHPGAVAVLASEGEEVVLVRQWRASLRRTILEVPAGTRDVEGEAPADTARRELEEETGLAAAVVEPLCSLWNSPGISDQRTDVFLATSLSAVLARPTGPEERAIEVVRLGLDDALAHLAEGPADATTALALRTLAARRGR